LKIAVCVKVVPDSAATVKVDKGTVTWGDAPLVINPWDEYAVEAALQLAEAGGGDVIALSLGDESAKEALKHALAMGCNEAVLVQDPAFANVDSQGAAKVLAAAVKHLGDVDLVLFGKQAIDGDTGVTHVQTARVLGYPAVTYVAKAELNGSTLKAERVMEEGRQTVQANLPAVLSIVKDFGEPRYPSFMGIRKASRAEIPALSLADLGIQAPAPLVTTDAINNPPERAIQNEIFSEGTSQEIAEKLADAIIAEKVL
jgi:electron transfer flavoprotein beta subunit